MELPRSSGILLHPTSLPGGHGTGDLGATARAFVDRLAAGNQSWWQVLPLNPPGGFGSPYSATSSMAANPTLIDLEDLASRGWLTSDELSSIAAPDDPTRVDFTAVKKAKNAALRQAFDRAPDAPAGFDAFCEREREWLPDHTLFAALRAAIGPDWRRWPEELVRRDEDALKRARRDYADEIDFATFCEWVFDEQWRALRSYASQRQVRFLGDVPIFVAMDSADVWANRKIFKVDALGHAEVVAGVPPDYFSPTGQKWGNPVYHWDVLRDDDYAWWKRRLSRTLELVDIVRIDHFRGFESYWEVPADAPTAETGEWQPGPGAEFFDWVRRTFDDVPFVAEDLGIITDEVIRLRDEQGLPGMKVMQFAFDGNPNHPFLPRNYPEHCVAYTGTHDNDTTLGWWQSTDEQTRHHARTYLSHPDEGIVWAMINDLLASDAALTIVPVQDIYELDSSARMNLPGTAEGNWSWRMAPGLLERDEPWERLGGLTDLYGREP